MHAIQAIVSISALSLFLLSGPVIAADQKAPEPKKAAGSQETSVPPPTTTIPVPEIAKQADDVAKLLRDLEALAKPPPAIEAIQARLPEVKARLGPELESTIETLKETPPPTVVARLALAWGLSRQELLADLEVLTNRATQLENAMEELAVLRDRWTQTRAAAQASGAPVAIVQRVNAVLADLEAARARLQAQRAAALVLQGRVAEEVARCDDALALIARHRQEAEMQKFARTTPAIWSRELSGREFAELLDRAHEAAVASAVQIRRFAGHNAARFFLQGLIFIGLILMARAARRRSHALVAAGEEAPRAAALFDCPYSSAALATLALTLGLFPERPRLVADVASVLMLLPILRIVRPLVEPALVPALYALAALYLTDRVRAELAVVPLADQSLMLLEMLFAGAGLAWLLVSGRLRRVLAGEPMAAEISPARRATAVFALAVCAVPFAAAAYGAMILARTLGPALLFTAFVAITAYAGVQVLDGLLAFALRVWPLRRLGIVERHRDLLERRGHRLLCWILAALWAAGTLRFIGVLDWVLELGQAALDAELRRGAMSISLGDVLAFVITVWLAFVVSAFIRFVLEEDVYPRLRLARGVPYVFSKLLHYAILVAGFLVAVAALGVDLNKVTILAGAFGVGLGFGLQGVVNNFVSGLIVLFERPINLGDAIQMGDLAGEVRRIGIRSTTVRTWEGAEVIVPNASLVYEKVTNWTHSDLLRRMDVPVGVAYGSAPEKVLEVLLAVARAHPGVLAEPAPQALFLGFGESALNFELRAWTGRFSQWVAIRSELCVAVYNAVNAAGMKIPFPHRVVQITREPEIESLTPPAGAGGSAGPDLRIESGSAKPKKQYD